MPKNVCCGVGRSREHCICLPSFLPSSLPACVSSSLRTWLGFNEMRCWRGLLKFINPVLVKIYETNWALCLNNDLHFCVHLGHNLWNVDENKECCKSKWNESFISASLFVEVMVFEILNYLNECSRIIMVCILLLKQQFV
jgi:hypothetical protein